MVCEHFPDKLTGILGLLPELLQVHLLSGPGWCRLLGNVRIDLLHRPGGWSLVGHLVVLLPHFSLGYNFLLPVARRIRIQFVLPAPGAHRDVQVREVHQGGMPVGHQRDHLLVVPKPFRTPNHTTLLAGQGARSDLSDEPLLGRIVCVLDLRPPSALANERPALAKQGSRGVMVMRRSSAAWCTRFNHMSEAHGPAYARQTHMR